MQKATSPGPAYEQAMQIAAELKTNDPYGKYKDKTEANMIALVFQQRPDLYELHRKEALDR